ncbi:MAG: serpin family protein [Candidatus Lokiarchaeota archaeon]|nr:serpin family protein [Candidatus Lokiarchaeota archaeon]
MVREFFKPNWKKIVLTILLLLITGFMAFKLMSVGLLNTLIPVVMVLGFPLVFSQMFGPIGLIVGLILEIFWLYLVSCILIKILTFLKNKLLLIRWDAKKFIVLCFILIIGFLVYGFFNFGWSDVLIATADDSGATVQGVNNIAKANNQFAIDLYSEINKDSDENIFFSPWSISTAVAMAYEGARGETANEIQSVFHFPTDDNSRRSSYAKMLNTLNKASGKYKLSTANAIWLQKDYPFLENYKDTISKYYLGEIKNLDFVNNPSGASSDINKWVSKNTNNKISNIVSPSMFNKMSRAVLTNAIYFKGKWEHQFDRDDTKPEDFTLQSGSKIKVPIMRLTDDELDFNYAEYDGVQILEMPYQGDKISMLVLLPRIDINDPMLQRRFEREGIEPQTSDMTQLESTLTEEKLQEWRNKLKPETVYIYMPKYTFETSYSLSDYLKSMGMNLPFTWPGADFSGMDGTNLLYIDKVLHKAYIDVYEEGTEAAAATVISMMAGAAMPHYVEFRADHPFIFIIQEKETGNILFMGRVNNPTQ